MNRLILLPGNSFFVHYSLYTLAYSVKFFLFHCMLDLRGFYLELILTKLTNAHIMGVSEEERKNGKKNIWRNNAWKHSKLNKRHDSTHPQIQQTPSRINTKSHTNTHYYQTVQRQRETLKSSRKSDSPHTVIFNNINSQFLIGDHGGQWNDLFKGLKF